MIDFSIIAPAVDSYCAEAAKKTLYTAKMREDAKEMTKYFQAYKNMDDVHLSRLSLLSGGGPFFFRLKLNILEYA